MNKGSKVFCEASEEIQSCEIEGSCKNSGAEYEVSIYKKSTRDSFLLCKGCSRKLEQQAEATGYVVKTRKLTKRDLKP